MSSQIYKKYNWQRASAELAICTARVEGHQVEPRALLYALRHYARCRRKMILADFNLPVSTQMAKFKLPPNFPAIRYVQGYTCAVFYSLQGCTIFVMSCRFGVTADDNDVTTC